MVQACLDVIAEDLAEVLLRVEHVLVADAKPGREGLRCLAKPVKVKGPLLFYGVEFVMVCGYDAGLMQAGQGEDKTIGKGDAVAGFEVPHRFDHVGTQVSDDVDGQLFQIVKQFICGILPRGSQGVVIDLGQVDRMHQAAIARGLEQALQLIRSRFIAQEGD